MRVLPTEFCEQQQHSYGVTILRESDDRALPGAHGVGHGGWRTHKRAHNISDRGAGSHLRNC